MGGHARDPYAMINIAHTDRNVFVTNIIDVGTFRTVENCSAHSKQPVASSIRDQHALVSVCRHADGAGLRG